VTQDENGDLHRRTTRFGRKAIVLSGINKKTEGKKKGGQALPNGEGKKKRKRHQRTKGAA